jgi:mitochondrial fission process protein 1
MSEANPNVPVPEIGADKCSSLETKRYNIFRDSPLRYAGYANEVGESFRYQLPRFVLPSYVIALSYCLGDAFCTGYRSCFKDVPSINHRNEKHSTQETERRKQALYQALDALAWQTAASVVLPGAVIHIVVKLTRAMVISATSSSTAAVATAAVNSTWSKGPALVREWTPTLAGLASIPWIISPIDQSVDFAMDHTTRKWFGSVNCDLEDGPKQCDGD